MRDCIACLKAKIKTKKIPKTTASPATFPGERLSIDISGMMAPSMGQNVYWTLIMDEFSKMKWYIFTRTKADMPAESLKKLQTIQKNLPKV